jgi:murein DD-endopeptidase MepM/ murein hydrolase activator NlpD
MAALAASSMLLGVAAVPLASADDLKHKKHQVQHRIHGARQDLDESSAQLRAATARLQAAQGKLDAAEAHLARTRGMLAAAVVLDRQMQAKLDQAIQRLQEARAQLGESRAKISEQEDVLGRIAVENYQHGDPALLGLSMVLTSQDPAELTSQLNSVHNVLDKEAVALDRLRATKVLLTVQEQKVEDAKQAVAVERRAAARNLARRKRLEAQATEAKQQVADLVRERRDARRDAEQAKQADLAQRRTLEAERDRISAMLRRRAEAARRRAAAAAAAQAGSTSSLNSGGFLDWPVSGPVTSPFGWRTHPIYGYRSLHDGIDIAAACGTPIHAPAAGRVLQEYFQTAWGNRIIIDHGYHNGAGVATIINHLSGYAVSAGSYVQRGQVVGYVGTTGWSTGCHTHFTVMANGNPVDPMNWL